MTRSVAQPIQPDPTSRLHYWAHLVMLKRDGIFSVSRQMKLTKRVPPTP